MAMPPLHSFDQETTGPVFLLHHKFDTATQRVMQPVRVTFPVDSKMKRELEMASYELSDDDLPEVIPVNKNDVSFMLAFPPGTPLMTIPTMVEIIMNELNARLKRHANYEQTGAYMAVAAEVEHH